MWFWQKREVYMGNSEEKCATVQTALKQADIVCEVIYRNGHNVAGIDTGRTFGRMGAGSASTGIYYVYVHYKDVQNAQVALQRI